MNLLSFLELRRANVTRCEEVFHPLHDWSLTDWATAMAGECGEACNIIKKIRRLEGADALENNPENRDKLEKAAGKELADLVIYADLLAAAMGIDLGAVVAAKFNEVSFRRRSTVFLPDDSAELKRPACALCDRGDGTLGHSDDCPRREGAGLQPPLTIAEAAGLMEMVVRMDDEESNINAAEQLARHNPDFELNDHLRKILGRICFQCIEIVAILRASGREIAWKAEEEQAATIHFLLKCYFQHGPGAWEVEANRELGQMRDVAVAALKDQKEGEA